ncbi:acyl-CoA dehydrogenase [Sesbania bispinosa]|nr:acyl-CoA dehydrogenase [Sesbania bispinosa]
MPPPHHQPLPNLPYTTNNSPNQAYHNDVDLRSIFETNRGERRRGKADVNVVKQ